MGPPRSKASEAKGSELPRASTRSLGRSASASKGPGPAWPVISEILIGPSWKPRGSLPVHVMAQSTPSLVRVLLQKARLSTDAHTHTRTVVHDPLRPLYNSLNSIRTPPRLASRDPRLACFRSGCQTGARLPHLDPDHHDKQIHQHIRRLHHKSSLLIVVDVIVAIAMIFIFFTRSREFTRISTSERLQYQAVVDTSCSWQHDTYALGGGELRLSALNQAFG